MPDYRLVYSVVYRVIASGDGDAAQKVMSDLGASFPNGKFVLVSVVQSPSQTIHGSTTYDVNIGASGVVQAASVSASLSVVTPPATLSPSGATRQSSTLMASINTAVEGVF